MQQRNSLVPRLTDLGSTDRFSGDNPHWGSNGSAFGPLLLTSRAVCVSRALFMLLTLVWALGSVENIIEGPLFVAAVWARRWSPIWPLNNDSLTVTFLASPIRPTMTAMEAGPALFHLPDQDDRRVESPAGRADPLNRLALGHLRRHL